MIGRHFFLYALVGIISCSLACRQSRSRQAEREPTTKENAFDLARRRMVEKDLKGRDITDKTVLEVMGRVPRHRFLPEAYHSEAYADYPLPIGEEQTISQPYIVALMTQWLQVGKGDTVLEVGTGSGYQAAVLAEIVSQVYTVEIRHILAQQADQLLKKLGYTNIQVRTGDGYLGWGEHAPYDGIIVTAAASQIPPPLVAQLKDGGRLVIPVDQPTGYQKLICLEKSGGETRSYDIANVRFVPLVRDTEHSN